MMVRLCWKTHQREVPPCIVLKLLPERKKGEVGIGVGDPPLRGTEGPISWQAPLLREVICFPEGWVGNVMGKLSALVQPLD